MHGLRLRYEQALALVLGTHVTVAVPPLFRCALRGISVTSVSNLICDTVAVSPLFLSVLSVASP